MYNTLTYTENALPFGNSLNVIPFVGGVIEETFINSGTGSNFVWSINNSSGASGPTNQQGETYHPGVWRVRTGTSNGSNVGNRALGTGGLTSYVLNSCLLHLKMQLKYVGNIVTALDDCNTCVGLFIGNNSLFTPTNGLYFHCNYSVYGDNVFRAVVAKTGSIAPILTKPATATFNGSTTWRNFEILIHGYLPVGQRYIEFGYSDESSGYRTDTDLVATITEAELATANVATPFDINNALTPGFTLQKFSGGLRTERQLWYDSVKIGVYYVIQ